MSGVEHVSPRGFTTKASEPALASRAERPRRTGRCPSAPLVRAASGAPPSLPWGFCLGRSISLPWGW